MTASEATLTTQSPRSELREMAAAVRHWPWQAKGFALGILLLYAPVIRETATVWLTEDQHAHGVFILPLTLFLLWIVRKELRQAVPNPTAWGLVPLVLGLGLETLSWVARIKFLPMLSLVPTLAGGILLLHGRNLWRISRFAVCFLIFAAPLPDMVTLPASTQIQGASTTCAVATMRVLGYPLIRTGNRIDTPNVSVEVAEVCSGFKKLTALFAFAFLYGYLFDIGPGKRALLALSAYPIALLANSIRISALIAIGTAGGMGALHAAHDGAEIAVLVVAFFLFTLFGRLLGCKTLRFSL